MLMFLYLHVYNYRHPCRIVAGHVDGDKEFGREAAAALAIRGTRRTENGGFLFTRDIRVKAVRDSQISDDCHTVMFLLFVWVMSVFVQKLSRLFPYSLQWSEPPLT